MQICQFYFMICSQNKNFHALVLFEDEGNLLVRSWAKVLCCASIHAYQLSMHDRAHSPFLELDDIS